MSRAICGRFQRNFRVRQMHRTGWSVQTALYPSKLCVVKPLHQAPRRILIVRISALGDIVFCTALLEGLRKAHPQAHIAWLATSGFSGILEGDPRLNEILRLPPQALNSFQGLRETRRMLRAEPRYDWVIDAQGLLKTRMLARMVAARRYIGFASKEPGAFLINRLVPKGGNPQHISSEYRFLAQELTATDPGPPRLIPSRMAHERADLMLHSTGLDAGFIALCPFTTRPQKHWAETHWARLAHRLQDFGLGRCVLFGGPQDMAAGKRIMQDMPRGTVDLVGATPLPDVPALLSRARLVIGVDTGLTHIGIAVRRPVLSLFGSTRPYTGGAESPLRVLYHDLPCAPCKRSPTCNGAFSCMRDMSPEEVASAAHALLLAS